MAFCSNCGQQLPEGANACPNCGTFVNPQAAPQQPVQQTPQQPVQQPQYQQVPQQPVDPQAQQGAAPVNATVMPDQDTQQNRGIAWLSYAGLLFLIPMFARKNSPYCQYHVKQGATLCAFNLVYAIVTQILLAIINAIFPGERYYGYVFHSGIYNVFNVLFNLGAIFFVVLMVIGIVNAASGKMKELPLIGKIPFIANLMDKIYAALNK